MAQAVEIYEGAVDKGLEGVVACTTGVSSIIDATLCFRGYTIEDLAANETFEEVVYLVGNDRLPKESELKAFQAEIGREMLLTDAQVAQLSQLPTKGVHPMAWLRTASSMLALWDADAQVTDATAQKRVAMRLSAKMGPL